MLRQVAQHAEDLDRAVAFYTDVLRLKPIGRFDPPGLAFFDVGGGTRLLLEQGAPPAILYLDVEDIDAEIERLRDTGVTIVDEPHVIFTHDGAMAPAGTEEWMAFFRDSEGNLVGLDELRAPR